MPNTPKDILRQQAAIPTDITKGTPLEGIGQSMTSVLTQVAGGLPELPTPQMQIPGLPQLPTGGAPELPGIPQVREFVRSLDSAVPKGFPQFAPSLPSAAPTKMPTNAGGANNPYPGSERVAPSPLLTEADQVRDLPLNTFRATK